MIKPQFAHFKLIPAFLFIFFFIKRSDCQTAESVLITGNFQNVSLISFLNDIENNHSVKFYYEPEWFQDITINQNFTKMPLAKTVDRVIFGTAYQYYIVQGAYIFLPKKEVADLKEKSNLHQSNNAQKQTKTDSDFTTIGSISTKDNSKFAEIKGYIINGTTNESIPGASIYIKNINVGTTSNIDGSYTLKLPVGSYKIMVECLGLEATFFNVKLLGSGNYNISLFEKSVKLDEVEVWARRPDQNISNNQMSLVQLDRKAIKQIPAMMGTKDILKSLTMLPGVKSVGEFGAEINVRGGANDQNLILIEGAPVFNTAHLFGLVSVISSDAISNVSLYKGDIPAKYGERVSSIVTIDLKHDNDKAFHASGGIGILDSRLNLEIPVIKNKLSILMGGRSTYSNYLLHLMPDVNLKNSTASFYDFNTLINWKINKKNSLSLFYYRSYDVMEYASELNYNYGNDIGTLKWSHEFSYRLNATLNVSFSKYNINKYDIKNDFEKSTTVSDLNYKTARLNFTYSPGKNKFDFGIQTIYYQIQPGKINPSDSNSLILPFKLNTEQAFENAVYLTDSYEINKQISITAGIRFSVYSLLGANTIYQYQPGISKSVYAITDSIVYGNKDVITSYQGIEPRISIKYRVNMASSVKLSYNRSNQYISLISYSSVSTPEDRWKLSDPYFKPLVCDQIALGYFRNFKQNTFETSVELYYKNIKNLVEYKNGAELTLNPYLETAVINAEGKNYGVEVLIKKNSGKLDGWVSYTYSRSFKKTSGVFSEETINSNTYYPSSYDKPHNLTVMSTYHFNRRWRASANFSFNSGRAITLPEYKYQVGTNWVIEYSDRNKYRLPTYHRLDLSISLDETLRLKKKWKGSWTLSILNVYGRKNAYSIFYKKDQPSSLNDYRMYSLYKMYIIGKPIPTLTYNFIF
jgi:hypothetical protein